MKEKYCSRRLKKLEQENDPWPPVKIKSYVTLALMYQKDLQTHKATTQTIHLRTKGDIFNIPRTVNSQKITDLTQIFSFPSGGTPTTILIEGQPGIGKTTLVKKICIEWAEGKLLTSDKLVLLLLLRDPNVQKITNVQQLIEHFIKSTSKVTQLQDYLEDNHGKDVTFIIDGFDKLSSKLRKRSFFKELIQKEVFTKSRIVVTSRPSASICLHNIVDTRIEVLGFDQTSKMEYASDALKDDLLQLENLHKHLQQYPNIDAMCYIPLVMSIIVFLCMCQIKDLPPTASKMYQKFVLHTICHYLKRTGTITKEKHINKIEHLPQKVQQVLRELEKIAFCSLINDIIVFTESDLPAICRDDPTCYGLLQSVQCYSENDAGAPLHSFNFLHLGIQEYFAANYVTILPEDEVHTLLKESFLVDYSNNDSKSVRLSNMWIMYCGIKHESLENVLKAITEGNLKPLSSELTIPQDILRDPVKVLYLFQCFQEAEDDTLSSMLSNSFDQSGVIDTSKYTLLPHLVMSLGFFLSKSNKNWKELNLSQCNIGDCGISVLHHYICRDKKCSINVTSIDLYSNSLTAASTAFLIDIITHLKPHTLSLGQNCFDSRLGDILAAAIKTVKKLDLKFSKFSTNELSRISKIVSCLEELDICWNELGDWGTIILLEGITKVKFSNQNQTVHSSVAAGNPSQNLVEGNSEMPYCHATNMCYLSSTVFVPAELSSTLRVLEISCNKIGVTGIRAISMALLYNTSIEVLAISSNQVNYKGAEAMAIAISNNKTLKELHIGANLLGDAGAVELLGAGSKNTTLKVLDISNNLINDVGAIAIAECLKVNNSLEVLKMGRNNIGQDGAMAISKAITINNTLKTLSLIGTLDFTNASKNCSDGYENTWITTIIRSLCYNNSIGKLVLPNNDDIVKKEVEAINNSKRKCNMQDLSVHYEIDRNLLNSLAKENTCTYEYSLDDILIDDDDDDIP